MSKNTTFVLVAVAVACIVVVAGLTVMNVIGEDEKKGITFVQSTGEEMTVEKADRLVVLNTYASDILILLGANERVVGNTKAVINHEDYGAYYKKSTDVGSASKPSIDTIISLEPDLIIVNDSPSYDYTQLYNSGIPTAKINCNRHESMLADLKALGIIAGNESKAAELETWYNKSMDLVKSNEVTLSGAFEYWYQTLSVQPNGSTLGTIGELAGIRNIFEGTKSMTPELATIIEKNPQIYIIGHMSGTWSKENAKNGITSLCARSGFDQIDAVKNGKVYAASIGITSGFRCCVGAAWMASLINSEFTVDVDGLLKELNTIGGVNYSTDLVYTYSQAYA